MNDVTQRSLWLIAISTGIVLVALAFGQPGGPHDPAGHTGMTGMTATGHATHADIGSEADFIAGMIPHHREAVDSARQVLERTERPEMRDLAQRVIEVQTEEIALLEGWLAAWYPAVAPDSAYEPMMRDLAGMSPGEADRTFLEDMLRHHEMAITMAQAYLEGSFEKRPEVTALAQEIVTVQHEENARMRAWLAAWYGDGAGHGGH